VKRIIYATILLFVVIMIAVMVVASLHDVVLVEYENGVVVEQTE
jgi:hypothetical protein